jgi:hypothetical protein
MHDKAAKLACCLVPCLHVEGPAGVFVCPCMCFCLCLSVCVPVWQACLCCWRCQVPTCTLLASVTATQPCCMCISTDHCVTQRLCSEDCVVLALQGTHVTSGHCSAVVVGTGAATAIGKIRDAMAASQVSGFHTTLITLFEQPRTAQDSTLVTQHISNTVLNSTGG